MASTNKDSTQLFTRIRLHGLTKSGNGTPCPIDLERRVSFPMPADHRRTGQHDKDLSACVLRPTYVIEARVCLDGRNGQEQAARDDLGGVLGFGRCGIVYALEILSIRSATSSPGESDESLELPTPPPLCIKLAIPSNARSLAREAWFYKQLDAKSLTGLIVPNCYGVFHASNVPKELVIDVPFPGFDYYEYASTPLLDRSELYTSPMREESYDFETNTLNLTKYFMDDEKGSWTNSEWRLFRETPAVTTMTVLLMDMLGPRLTLEDFEKDWDGELNDICDHLIPFDIINDDIRLPNILRVPPHLQVPCPMHPNALPGHKWNIADWEAARVTRAVKSRVASWAQRHSIPSDYYASGGKDRTCKYRSRTLDPSFR